VLIKVLTVHDDEPAIVECETPVGNLTARWRGGELPSADETHDVEVESVGHLVWGENLKVSAEIARTEDETSLIGLVEDVEGAAVTLRVGDSILLLEADGEPPLGVLGEMASVRPREFELWPTGI
jgi:hypothetical protein